MKRRLLTILLAGLMGLGLAGFASADDGSGSSGDNTAYATNNTNGATVVKTAFAIRHVMNGVVDQTNAAVAYASCTDCTTVAIAIEIVLVESSPTVVNPQNVAIAVNELCSLCVTVANALQFVVGTDGPVQFDEQGREALERIRHELDRIKDDLKDGRLTLEQLQAKIESIRSRVRDILQNHLVPVGNRDRRHRFDREQNAESRNSAPSTTSTTTSTPTTTSTATDTTTTTTTTTPTTTGVTTTSGP